MRKPDSVRRRDLATVLRTVAPVLAAFKRGRRTREPVRLHKP